MSQDSIADSRKKLSSLRLIQEWKTSVVQELGIRETRHTCLNASAAVSEPNRAKSTFSSLVQFCPRWRTPLFDHFPEGFCVTERLEFAQGLLSSQKLLVFCFAPWFCAGVGALRRTNSLHIIRTFLEKTKAPGGPSKSPYATLSLLCRLHTASASLTAATAF